jgi:hypothetical protein
MNKFTFTVELVHDSLDCDTIVSMLNRAVDGVAEYTSVDHTDTKTLSEQGFKVWAKRKVGISLAAPKPAKKPKQVAETVEA